MKRPSLSSLALAAVLGLPMWLPNPCGRAADDASALARADRDQINHWIRQLGDDDFDVRDAATRALMDHPEAAPALRKARLSVDAEARKRAAEILAALDRKRAPQELDKALGLAKDGRIDEVVERLVRWQGADDSKKGWEATYQLAARAAETADHDYAKGGLVLNRIFPSGGSFQDLVGPNPSEVILAPKPMSRWISCIIRRVAIQSDSEFRCRGSIVAASRSMQLRSAAIECSIVVCGGDVEVGSVHRSIVVCDGDFTASQALHGSIVIARGMIKCPAGDGVLFTSGREVTFPHGLKSEWCVIRTGEAHPLGFIKFFDPAEAGVEASAEGDGTRVPDGVLVKSVAKDKPFAAAGLQAGDVITAVGDEKIDASGKADDQFQSFRRPLRKMLAADEEFTLTVRRGDKTIDLTVKPAD